MKASLVIAVLTGISTMVATFQSLRSGSTLPTRRQKVARPNFRFSHNPEPIERRQTTCFPFITHSIVDYFQFSFSITVNESLPNDLCDPTQSGEIGKVRNASEEISFIHFDLPPADQIQGLITDQTECIAVIFPDSVLNNPEIGAMPLVQMFSLSPGEGLDGSSLTFDTHPTIDQRLNAVTYGGVTGFRPVHVDQFVRQKCNFGGGMDFAARSIRENSFISFAFDPSLPDSTGVVIFVVNP
jgi:hypothetical protein